MDGKPVLVRCNNLVLGASALLEPAIVGRLDLERWEPDRRIVLGQTLTVLSQADP